MEEKYSYWKPSKVITPDYFVKTITYGADGISVVLQSSDANKDLVKFNFGASIDLYRVCDEGVRQTLISDLYDFFGDDAFSFGRMFTVRNSRLIKWVEEESGYLECFDLQHFILMNDDSVFDIVARCSPEVEVVKQ